MLFHVEFKAVGPVAIFIVKVQVSVANINAGPMIKTVRERSREDGHQIRADAEAANLGGSCERPVAPPIGVS